MRVEVLVPGSQLMESMRAVGYSTATAAADIVDNSITAHAKRIDIIFVSDGDDPYVAFLDDGDGMSRDVARRAMQLAGTSSAEARAESDLGRFGLGLKTASLSQCRKLTMITKAAGVLTAFVWDIDLIAKTNQWSLGSLDVEECKGLPGFAKLADMESGTLVIWSQLDRFLPVSSRSRALDQAMVDVRDHVSLVFHRFLSGESDLNRVRVFINNNEISASDPFLSSSSRTQVSRREVISVEGKEIAVQAFTLPYLAKMTSAERAKASIAGSVRDSQGFYIYRGGRLVIWGTWFRLMPKSEMGKLARVKVDVPNSLDHLWSLDIKKSSAVPPVEVRDRLRALAGSMVEPSKRVHTFRGRKDQVIDELVHSWNVIVDRESFRYEINRAHPAIEAVAQSLDSSGLRALQVALSILERTFPAQDLNNRMTGDLLPDEGGGTGELRPILESLWLSELASGSQITASAFVERMLAVEPLNQLASERGALVEALETLGRGSHE